DELTHSIATLPILDLPETGDVIDDFTLGEILSDGRYSRLFKARDKRHGRELVLQFPHPRVASEGSSRLAFVREAWVAARVRSLWIGEIVELPADRQTRLYSVMPLYEGETLEQRLNRSPQLSLSEGIGIATKLARAVATLHRAGIIHRDIKPDYLSRYRPDLPAWLDAVVGKALNVDPAHRYGDVIEFSHELENGAMWAKPAVTSRRSLYDRDPLVFWKSLSAGLIVLVILLL